MLGLPIFGKKKAGIPQAQLARSARVLKPAREKSGSALKSVESRISLPGDYGYYERITLYRFLRENIPIINGAIWVWVRLCASPIELYLDNDASGKKMIALKPYIDDLDARLSPTPYAKFGGLERLCDLFFSSLFVDGAFAAGLELNENGRLAGLALCDVRRLTFETEVGDDGRQGWRIYHETESGRKLLDPATFVFIPLDDDVNDPRGKSVLQSVGFVSRLEQKLLDDMQKSQEKAGYNRVHVLIKKPERRLGETEAAYIERANSYFDDTVTLFSGIRPADSAVTWDDIEIKTVGPDSGSGSGTHSWFLSHRALVEDICAGTHLDPFMLGYSYSSTQTWARFKYELVMREIVSVQKLAKSFLEWLVNAHLSLSGVTQRVFVRFNNDRVNSILERYRAEHEAADKVIDLFKTGLISKDEARERIFKNEGMR